jgi:hypothetical protein
MASVRRNLLKAQGLRPFGWAKYADNEVAPSLGREWDGKRPAEQIPSDGAPPQLSEMVE